MRLFTIGDSISQGFMSGSAARTDCAYSTLLANWLGLNGAPSANEGVNYYYPSWPEPGIPASVEKIFRALNTSFGSSISGVEWIKAIKVVAEVLNASEKYYERGEGAKNKPYIGNVPYFHNIGIRDWTVADSWLVTPEVCRNMINKSWFSEITDGFLANPSAYIYRTGLKVLDPNLDCNRSQIDWLEFHAVHEGIDNLILWLGANNALKTVVTLKVSETGIKSGKRPVDLSHEERDAAGWNLWRPEDFHDEYSMLIAKVDASLRKNKTGAFNVFVGTVPLVTAIPILTGLGKREKIDNKGYYYEYYTYFPFDEKFATESGKCLTMQDAIKIDDYIAKYNESIKSIVALYNENHLKENGRMPYRIVDMAEKFNTIAWQRNNGTPTYAFPSEWKAWHHFPDARYYHVNDNGELKRGGLFTLDGIHPSSIGHGLLASEFRSAMECAGVKFEKGIDWNAIRKTDTLYEFPISLIGELYRHEKLAHFVAKILNLFK